jgi:hypothetical protein
MLGGLTRLPRLSHVPPYVQLIRSIYYTYYCLQGCLHGIPSPHNSPARQAVQHTQGNITLTAASRATYRIGLAVD